MVEIRLPNITGKTQAEQLSQIKTYLFSVTEQLNWALKSIETGIGTNNAVVVKNGEKQPLNASTEKTPAEIFSEIKSLIIKSADIIEAYSEEISKQLEGEYVAVSDFGTYKEETKAFLSATSEEISALFSSTQTIESDVASIQNLISSDGSTTLILSTDAWVKIGAVAVEDSGHNLYGMEIGQTNEVNGEKINTKFAQYTSEGIYLFDGNSPVWSVRLARNTLTVNAIEVRTSFRQGGFKTTVRTDGSLIKRWIGVE